MPFFQSVQVKMSSGNGTGMQSLERVQSASYNYSVPRADVGQLGRFKMLNQRPVINYTPVSFSIDAVKSSKEIETNLGLLNTTGVGIAIGKANGLNISDFGVRNLEFYNSNPSASTNFDKHTILSGCLNSYSVSAAVNEPAKVSFNGEAFDVRIENNTEAVTNTNLATAIVRGQDVSITGIQFSGFGLTGFRPNNFSLNLSFGRQAVGYFGQKFPERPVTNVGATLSMNGFYEGANPLSGLSTLDCGFPLTGSIFLTLVPSCSGGGLATTYQCVNPYLDSFNFGATIGSFTSIDLGLSIPISVNPAEAADGSNLIIT
jgi:hypothetical protein